MGMIGDIFSRFAKDPLGFIKRAFYKTIIGPLKYRQGNDYDAARYWDDRLSRYGDSLKGPGDEGKSDHDNVKEYARDERTFLEICQSEKIDFATAKVMDIGCGTGFYADILQRQGVRNYAGVDITDALFPNLKIRFPQYGFVKKDITSEKAEGNYNLIFMIEVLEHIVNDDKMTFAMENIKRCLTNGGVFIISSVWKVSKRHMFYVRKWSLDEIKQRFPGYTISPLRPFRSSNILAIRKP